MTAQNSHAAAPTKSASTQTEIFIEHLARCERILILAVDMIDGEILQLLESGEYPGPCSFRVVGSRSAAFTDARQRSLDAIASLRNCRVKCLPTIPSEETSTTPCKSQKPDRRQPSLDPASSSVSDPEKQPGRRRSMPRPQSSSDLPSSAPVSDPPALTSNQDAGGSFLPAATRESEAGGGGN